MKPSPTQIETLVRMALDEDAPHGDITSQTLIPAETRITAQLSAREPGILCGEDIFTAAFTLTDPAVSVAFTLHDAERFQKSQTLATIQGPARAILQAERVALNFLQRLCGIATLTAAYVSEIAGTKCRIVDTRKTTPGLRLIERYAVRCGGGSNHRFSLSDAVMAKDNHLAAAGSNFAQALIALRAKLPHTTHIEVEVDRLDQIEPILSSGAVDTIMLDNFSTPDLIRGVRQVAGRALIEASGGITLPRVREVALAGVDIISIGALTHSVRALDLGLDMEPQ